MGIVVKNFHQGSPVGDQRRERLLVHALQRLLRSFPSNVPQTAPRIRADVLRLADLTEGLRTLAKSRLRQLTEADSARQRVLAYLNLFVGRRLSGRELQAVGGIQEVARRIRELRVQYGYSISTGLSKSGFRSDEYVLKSLRPSRRDAKQWRTANRIRRSNAAVKAKWLALLSKYVGKPVSKEQLAYVAPNRDLRRVRELRTQDGWRVVTRQSGRPDLALGTYVLESLSQLPTHDRKVAAGVYDAVLDRDDQRCRRCGWSIAKRNPSTKRQYLEVHHIEHHVRGGKNNKNNLITLCNVDHDEVHKLGLSGPQFMAWLRTGRRRAQ